MDHPTSARLQAAIIAVAPATLLAAFLSHPHIPGRLPNHEALAAAVVADPTLWGLAHLAFAVASGLLVLAFLALRSFLRAAGEDRSSAWGVPFVVMGSTLYTLLPGMEFAPYAAALTGADVVAAQAALDGWFVPILFTGAVTFALGTLGFVLGIVRSGVLAPPLLWIVTGALLVMAASRLVPLAAVQFHVQGVAALVGFWPLAYVMWKGSRNPARDRALAGRSPPSTFTHTIHGDDR